MISFSPVLNINSSWLCLRDPKSNLIYFVHSKCACSLYKKLFYKLGWVDASTAEINWDTNIVFSFIRKPLEKQRVGILEWFFRNNLENLLIQNKNNTDFLQLLSRIVYIDQHSMSIYDHLGKDSQKLVWFPIDQPDFDHKNKILDFIELHSAPIPAQIKQWFLDIPRVYESIGIKKEYKLKLLKIPPTSLIIKYIDYDQCLYDYAVTQLLGNYPE